MTNTLLRIYRGPDDDGPDDTPPAGRPLPWWAGRRHLSVGEFLSAFPVRDANPGSLGVAVKAFARQIGRAGEAIRTAPTMTFPTGCNRWPLDLLCDFFDGRMIGGVLIEAAWMRDVAAAPGRAAA